MIAGFWPSNRKEKKEKKNEKKTSTNPKTSKPITTQQQQQQPQQQQHQQQQQQQTTSVLDDNNLPDENNDFHRMMGSMDGLNQISHLAKSKCVSCSHSITYYLLIILSSIFQPTPEPYTQSSPSMPPSSMHRPVCQSTIPFSSSAMRKSTSSSDTSDDDDDDDFPISKIQFKINPTAQKLPVTEENDETKISNAMRLVDKNIGHFATYSRAVGRVSDME